MPRPQNKGELIQAATTQYEKLKNTISSLRKKELETCFNFENDDKKREAHWERDKNLRDILVHLYEWHILLFDWVRSNQKGDDKPFLPHPYTWKTYGKMNVEIWKKHQKTTLTQATQFLEDSHKKALLLINTFSNDELFVKRYFPWTGTTSLGSYCISATSSHYDWAIKKLKAHIKNCKKL